MTLSISQRAQRAENSMKRAVAALCAAEPGWLRGYEAERMLWAMLFESDALVDLLNDEAEYDDLRRFANDLQSALRRRHLVLKMENTEGRTPEEAEAFDAKLSYLQR